MDKTLVEILRGLKGEVISVIAVEGESLTLEEFDFKYDQDKIVLQGHDEEESREYTLHTNNIKKFNTDDLEGFRVDIETTEGDVIIEVF